MNCLPLAPVFDNISFVISARGKTQLNVNGYLYTRGKLHGDLQYWSCNQYRILSCTARASTVRCKQGEKPTIKLRGFHNHPIIVDRRRPGECARLKELYAPPPRQVLPDKKKSQQPPKQPLPPIEQCFVKEEK